MDKQPKTFICDSCGQESIEGLTEEEVIQEYEDNFQRPFNKEDVSIICDDCYNTFLSGYKQEPS